MSAHKREAGLWQRIGTSVFVLGHRKTPPVREMANRFYFQVASQEGFSTKQEAEELAQKLLDFLNSQPKE